MESNHVNAVSITLGLLDEMLCEFEQWAHGRNDHGALYRERNSLDDEQRRKINAEIAAIRVLLSKMRDDLHLNVTERDAAVAIWSRGMAFWENLVELESKQLRRYGELPPGLADYLDPKIAELIERLGRISEATHRI